MRAGARPVPVVIVPFAFAGFAATVVLVAAFWHEEGLPYPWEEGVSIVGCAFLVLGYALFGGFGAIFGMVALMAVHWGWQTWRQWRAATTHQPTVPGA